VQVINSKLLKLFKQ